MTLVIDQPGVYPDLPEDTYHADPVPGRSLSVTWAKKLLKPAGPARFLWELHNGGTPRTQSLDFGKLAHAIILGVGAEWEELPGDDLRARETRLAAEEIRAAGKMPVKPRDLAQVYEMVQAIEANPEAVAALTGTPEVSMFRRDDATGVMLRGRADCIGPGGIADYKTVAGFADPWTFTKTVATYRWHQQAAWYLDMHDTLDIDCPARFRFVAQEKTPPYLVNVLELSPRYLEIGRRDNDRAVEIFMRCMETDTWPAYEPVTHMIEPPDWLGRDVLDPDLEAQLTALANEWSPEE